MCHVFRNSHAKNKYINKKTERKESIEINILSQCLVYEKHFFNGTNSLILLFFEYLACFRALLYEETVKSGNLYFKL